jgi:Domain of unknown function (DUF4465)
MKNNKQLLMAVVIAVAGISLSSCEKDEVKMDRINFEELELDESGFYNGSDLSGGFLSGNVFFKTKYDPQWESWSGFAYTNHKDVTTGDYTNQYSCIAGSGDDGSEKYAVLYIFSDNPANADTIEFIIPEKVTNISFCNSTYAYKTMENGNAFAKKFGGESGSDEDFFNLMVDAYDENDIKIAGVTIQLANFTFSDNSMDYIGNAWTDVDLSALGYIKYFVFSFDSSDTGDFGINTPTYVCIDNIFGELMD